ncbi:AAA family ATPase [Mediterraneibacter sp. HCN-7094]
MTFADVKGLASCLNRYYGQKVIILLDEYDTPMQEALKQIEEKQYDAELLEQGIKKSQTRKIKDKKMHIFFVLVLF